MECWHPLATVLQWKRQNNTIVRFQQQNDDDNNDDDDNSYENDEQIHNNNNNNNNNNNQTQQHLQNTTKIKQQQEQQHDHEHEQHDDRMQDNNHNNNKSKDVDEKNLKNVVSQLIPDRTKNTNQTGSQFTKTTTTTKTKTTTISTNINSTNDTNNPQPPSTISTTIITTTPPITPKQKKNEFLLLDIVGVTGLTSCFLQQQEQEENQQLTEPTTTSTTTKSSLTSSSLICNPYCVVKSCCTSTPVVTTTDNSSSLTSSTTTTTTTPTTAKNHMIQEIHRTSTIYNDPNPIYTVKTNSLCLLEIIKKDDDHDIHHENENDNNTSPNKTNSNQLFNDHTQPLSFYYTIEIWNHESSSNPLRLLSSSSSNNDHHCAKKGNPKMSLFGSVTLPSSTELLRNHCTGERIEYEVIPNQHDDDDDGNKITNRKNSAVPMQKDPSSSSSSLCLLSLRIRVATEWDILFVTKWKEQQQIEQCILPKIQQQQSSSSFSSSSLLTTPSPPLLPILTKCIDADNNNNNNHKDGNPDHIDIATDIDFQKVQFQPLLQWNTTTTTTTTSSSSSTNPMNGNSNMKNEKVKLYRTKPYPDPNRKQETEWFTKEQLIHESIQPSTNWIEVGSGENTNTYAGDSSSSSSSTCCCSIEIIGCTNLPNCDKVQKNLLLNLNRQEASDPFVTIIYDDCCPVRTDIIWDTNSPRWLPWTNRAYKFYLKNDASSTTTLFFLSVFDYDPTPIDAHDPIGRVVLDVRQFQTGISYVLHYPLQKNTKKTSKKVKQQQKIEDPCNNKTNEKQTKEDNNSMGIHNKTTDGSNQNQCTESTTTITHFDDNNNKDEATLIIRLSMEWVTNHPTAVPYRTNPNIFSSLLLRNPFGRTKSDQHAQHEQQQQQEQLHQQQQSSYYDRSMINVNTKKGYKVVQYTTHGGLDRLLDDHPFSYDSLQFYLNEILSYWDSICYTMDVILQIWLWRGRIQLFSYDDNTNNSKKVNSVAPQASAQTEEHQPQTTETTTTTTTTRSSSSSAMRRTIWFPIHSIVFWLAVLYLIDHPEKMGPVVCFLFSWILLSINYYSSKHPYPWYRTESYFTVMYRRILSVLFPFFGYHSTTYRSHPSRQKNNIKPGEGYQEMVRLNKLSKYKQQRIVSLLLAMVLFVLKLISIYSRTGDDAVIMATNQQRKTKRAWYTYFVSEYILLLQMIPKYVFTYLRGIRSFFNWRTSTTYVVTTQLLIVAIVWWIVPVNWILYWTLRVSAFIFLGPLMKVVDILWIQSWFKIDEELLQRIVDHDTMKDPSTQSDNKDDNDIDDNDIDFFDLQSHFWDSNPFIRYYLHIGRMKMEELMKLKDMREILYGPYSTIVPRTDNSLQPSIPLPQSSATVLVPPPSSCEKTTLSPSSTSLPTSTRKRINSPFLNTTNISPMKTTTSTTGIQQQPTDAERKVQQRPDLRRYHVSSQNGVGHMVPVVPIVSSRCITKNPDGTDLTEFEKKNN